jgi:hypothetical protein
MDDKKTVQGNEGVRKVLLGKKTIRHFAVKTNIQTGNTSTGANCGASASVTAPTTASFQINTTVRC